MKNKAARDINKNCSINQEFFFAHPACKFQLNSIYNCHFSGCYTWDLFSQCAGRFYFTDNRSLKVLGDLPLGTHQCENHYRIKLQENPAEDYPIKIKC